MRRCFAVALFGAALLFCGQGLLAQDDTTAEYVGSYRWRGQVEKFGGFSGLEVSVDGSTFWAVSDGGLFVEGQIERSRGVISAVVNTGFFDLKSPSGEETIGVWDDAEGLAIDAQNRAFVSFEGEHRVWRYDHPGTNAIAINQHKDFAGLQNNSALEVLAIDPQGRLFTLPERSGVLTRPFPVYRLEKDGWAQSFGLRRQSPFLPVGGDFGPDGKFYLLERHFSGLLGFQTRVRRFDVTETGMENEVTLLETRSGLHDNLEGIAAWRDASGAIRLTMISDDNYRAFQRTEFVEYRVRE